MVVESHPKSFESQTYMCIFILQGIRKYMNHWKYQHTSPNHVLVYNIMDFDVICCCIGTSKVYTKKSAWLSSKLLSSHKWW